MGSRSATLGGIQGSAHGSRRLGTLLSLLLLIKTQISGRVPRGASASRRIPLRSAAPPAPVNDVGMQHKKLHLFRRRRIKFHQTKLFAPHAVHAPPDFFNLKINRRKPSVDGCNMCRPKDLLNLSRRLTGTRQQIQRHHPAVDAFVCGDDVAGSASQIDGSSDVESDARPH